MNLEKPKFLCGSINYFFSFAFFFKGTDKKEKKMYFHLSRYSHVLYFHFEACTAQVPIIFALN